MYRYYAHRDSFVQLYLCSCAFLCGGNRSSRAHRQSAILINADTGEVLYDKYKDFQTYPASTTKVMTALLALEHLDLDQVCTISHDASYTEGSRIFLLEGEQVTVEQLLYAMLLASANDAAIALAEACAGMWTVLRR